MELFKRSCSRSRGQRTGVALGRRRLPLSLERLESRTLLSGDSILPSVVPLPPPEPARTVPLCAFNAEGIYYDPATQTVCIVGGESDDRVRVFMEAGNFVAHLQAGGLSFSFSADNDLFARFLVDTRGGGDGVGVAANVLQRSIIDVGTGDRKSKIGRAHV